MGDSYVGQCICRARSCAIYSAGQGPVGSGGRGPEREIPLGDGTLADRRQSTFPRREGLSRQQRQSGLHKPTAQLGAVLQGATAGEELHVLGVVLRCDEADQGAPAWTLDRRLYTWICQEEAGRGDAHHVRKRDVPLAILRLGTWRCHDCMGWRR